MPKLWSDTIVDHRQSVRDATLDATAALVSEHGLTSVTMAQIARTTGIGRATLYKYFPDIESILVAWHQRAIARHMEELVAVGHAQFAPIDALEAVLTAYVQRASGHKAHAQGRLLHSLPHAARAEQHLQNFIRDLILRAANAGAVRSDIPAQELSAYVVAALTAVEDLHSKAAATRLIAVTLDGLRAKAVAGKG